MNHPGDARRRRAPPPDNRRAVPRSSLQLVTFSLALAAVTLPEISAHPTLVEHELCGDEAHPTTKRHHGAPVHDGTISFLLSWAAPDGSADPQPDEDQPKRRIPEEQNIATAEYKPGGRHVLTVTIPLEGELLLTASAGAFEEFGQHNDGKLNYGRATMCDGKRSNLKGDWSTAMFVWTAPTLAVENGGVKFRITTARGSHAGFRQNDVTLSPNADLPLPGAAAAAPSANYYPPPHGASLNTSTGVGGVVGGEGEPINVKFVIHGWLMAVGWGFFVPAGVWAVRYLRPPDDAPPAKSALVESLRSRWLQLHWMINAAGLSCAAVGLFLSYSAVEDESGGGDDTASAHLSSNHSYYGAGTLLLGMYQPLNAFLRPANTNNNLAGSGAGGSGSGGGKSTPRVRWERVHRVAGVLGLFLSAVAVTSGAEVAEEWGAVKGGPLAYNAYVAWVVLAAVATCVMEAVRWRERRGVEAAWRGTESRSFVELTEDI